MTARIKIIAASEVHALPIELPGVGKTVIPIDGKFHPINPDFLPMLRDCAVEFEVEEDAPEPEQATEVGGDDGLGGSASPPSPEPSQLDRDGDGQPGGSLPGNETVPAAKGKRKPRKG